MLLVHPVVGACILRSSVFCESVIASILLLLCVMSSLSVVLHKDQEAHRRPVCFCWLEYCRELCVVTLCFIEAASFGSASILKT
jgi:hypothetical protein